mmetsp:Transcript_983/g.3342  ORF Transcript_983/g.3342 Transcript_983/m.3342 type:complete len:724 (+) Transcript_983:438-2609(+)
MSAAGSLSSSRMSLVARNNGKSSLSSSSLPPPPPPPPKGFSSSMSSTAARDGRSVSKSPAKGSAVALSKALVAANICPRCVVLRTLDLLLWKKQKPRKMGNTPSTATGDHNVARAPRQMLLSREWRLAQGREWLRESSEVIHEAPEKRNFGEEDSADQKVSSSFDDEEETRTEEGDPSSSSSPKAPRASSFRCAVWRRLLSERERQSKDAHLGAAVTRILAAYNIRRNDDDDARRRTFSERLRSLVAVLLLFVEEREVPRLLEALWRVAPGHFFDAGGTFAEAAVAKELLARLPFSRREAYDERLRAAEMVTMKMAVLVDVVDPEVTVAILRRIFVDKSFDVVPCCVAAHVEAVARCRASLRRRTGGGAALLVEDDDGDDNAEEEERDESLLCAALRALERGSPAASADDVQAAARHLARIDVNAIRLVENAASLPPRKEDSRRGGPYPRLRLLKEDKEGAAVVQLPKLREAFLRATSPEDRRLDRRDQFLDVVRAAGVDAVAVENVVDFRELLCRLASASEGSIEDRLAFQFGLYDVDGAGDLAWADVRLLANASDAPLELLRRLRALQDATTTKKIGEEKWLLTASSGPGVLRDLGFDLSHESSSRRSKQAEQKKTDVVTVKSPLVCQPLDSHNEPTTHQKFHALSVTRPLDAETSCEAPRSRFLSPSETTPSSSSSQQHKPPSSSLAKGRSRATPVDIRQTNVAPLLCCIQCLRHRHHIK